MPEELWVEVRDVVQEAGIKTIHEKKQCKKAKWLSDEDLQIAEERRDMKSKREKRAGNCLLTCFFLSFPPNISLKVA